MGSRNYRYHPRCPSNVSVILKSRTQEGFEAEVYTYGYQRSFLLVVSTEQIPSLEPFVLEAVRQRFG